MKQSSNGKPERQPDIIDLVIGEKRLSELTPDELRQAMKQIELELLKPRDRRE